MDKFEIQDAQRLLSQAGDLAQINQNIKRIQEELQANINQINDAWQSDTEDKEAYLSGINKSLTKIGTLCSAVGSLANQLTNYAEESMRVANNG